MDTKLTQLVAKELAKRLDTSQSSVRVQRVGYITSITDGVIKISGLPHVAYMELLRCKGDVAAVAVNLEEDTIGAIVLGDYLTLAEGDSVEAVGELLSVPVGDGFLGRVIDPLGNPVDGKGEIKAAKRYPMEKVAPGVTMRQPVNSPLQTGIKAIDAMIPIGRGQRELIIGDRNTGKTAIVVDAIINQKKENIICIYVAIGQKTSRIAQTVAALGKYKALSHTIVVAASASDPASFQYLAPYAGCALAEYFMDAGGDVLIVYDDLSKHAWAYRQISLILRRPSGREAYPGDVFYLHSRLLERACRLDEDHGGGSITALPIIETLANDVSAYIPTNVISITDGQLYLESDLFYAGQRPAINVGLSVSRVGAAAQNKGMKKVAGSLRLDLAQYRELAAFAQFSSDLDEATKKQIDRGARMTELLKQGQFVPMPVEKQIAIIWAGINGSLDDIAVSKVTEFEEAYVSFLETKHAKLLAAIAKERTITPEIEEQLKKAVGDFKKTFV
ncbi:F0F1 ATP synthase subunit alpha [Candidatus Gottesmanbacteria bacterium]|nr:F0F1 ATP synthase subunit alpha [Candidatus Gottesmanbacteria bacterium]